MRLLPILLLCSAACMAQQKSIQSVTQSCSTTGLKKNLYYLASDKMQGRMMGSHGDTLASRFIAGWYKLNGLQAPYRKGKSYEQPVRAIRKTSQATLSINGKAHAYLDGWLLRPNQPTELKNVPVYYVNQPSMQEFYRDLPDMAVREKAVFFSTSLIHSLSIKGLDSMETALQKEGALAVGWTDVTSTRLIERQRSRQFLPQFVQPNSPIPPATPLPEVNLTPARLRELMLADGVIVSDEGVLAIPADKKYFATKAVISIIAQVQFTETHAPNVIGIIKGTDTTLASVVISAHHHDGANGKDIYYGAVDNASGTVAIMEVAAMMHRAGKQGLKPNRTIVFASFTGEERGLMGSLWYMDHPVYSMAKTYAVLNIDMFGRTDTLHSRHKMADSANYAYILVKDTLGRGLRNALYSANDSSVKLTLDTHYEDPKYIMRRLTGSDQYPFYLKGVPFLRIDCGFNDDYHKPTDTPVKVNFELLTKQTQLAFTTLWNIANL